MSAASPGAATSVTTISLLPRGRGTDKLPIIGAVERGGHLVAQPSLRVNAAALTEFLNRNIDADSSLLVTDQFPGYRRIRQYIKHVTVDPLQTVR